MALLSLALFWSPVYRTLVWGCLAANKCFSWIKGVFGQCLFCWNDVLLTSVRIVLGLSGACWSYQVPADIVRCLLILSGASWSCQVPANLIRCLLVMSGACWSCQVPADLEGLFAFWWLVSIDCISRRLHLKLSYDSATDFIKSAYLCFCLSNVTWLKCCW